VNWKRIVLSAIFYALFVSGFSAKAENIDSKNLKNTVPVADSEEYLRKQLAHVLLKAEKQEKDATRIKITAAAMLGNHCYSGCDEKTFDAINDLELNAKRGKYLVLRVLDSCNYLNKEIGKLTIPNDEKVKLQCRVDELKSAAENYGIVITRPLSGVIKKNVEIIDVNQQLQVVILGAGLLDGVKTGLLLTVKTKDARVGLTVISVREHISCAMITEGSSNNLDIGMKACIN